MTRRRVASLLCLVLGTAAAQEQERPDLTGVWGTYRAAGQAAPVRGALPPELPLRPEARAKVEEYRELVAPRGVQPGEVCLGAGMPGSMLSSGGYPMEIVQHDQLIIVVYELHGETRRIYLGEPAAEADLFPERNGYSVGRWEGAKLIVETTHLKEAVDQRQYPHSDQARIVEEYEMMVDDSGDKVLVASMVMTDPVFYTEPVRTEKRWSFLPGVRLLPYECNEPLWEELLQRMRQERDAAVTH